MAVCPSVRLSVCPLHAGTVSKQLNESSSFLAQRISSTYSISVLEGNSVSPKIRVLPSGMLSQTVDFEKFRNCMLTVTSVVNYDGQSV